MAYKVIITRHAQDDLDSILNYLTIVLRNPQAAAKLLDDIEACYDLLSNMPYSFEPCQNPRLSMKEYRKAVIRGYLAIYQVQKNNSVVQILRFFHGKQDYEKLL